MNFDAIQLLLESPICMCERLCVCEYVQFAGCLRLSDKIISHESTASRSPILHAPLTKAARCGGAYGLLFHSTNIYLFTLNSI